MDEIWSKKGDLVEFGLQALINTWSHSSVDRNLEDQPKCQSALGCQTPIKFDSFACFARFGVVVLAEKCTWTGFCGFLMV